MKRRDKILLTSLILFNEEGEHNVTTVDISNEMDISPGNLYYHFKGKDPIIVELYDQFESELIDILQAPIDQTLNTQDSWFYLYVVFEHMYKFRFFYANLADILQRNPDINKRFKRLLKRKYETAFTLLTLLTESNVLAIEIGALDEITENILLILTHWINHANYRDMPDNEVIIIHRGVFQMMSIVAPYFQEQYQYLYKECLDLYQNLLAEAS